MNKNLSKIPVIQNYMIPSQKNDLENDDRSICIIFALWRTLSNVKKYLIITRNATLKFSYPTFFDSKNKK
jgi:hypothetical protein